MSKVKQLEDAQLESFDWEFVGPVKKEVIARLIDRDFPTQKFSFVDIGGGNGVFTDWLLEQYPDSTGIVLDNSEMLLSKNIEHERKKLILGSATELTSYFSQEVDVVFFNYVLHHLITKGFSSTRKTQIQAMQQAKSILSKSGRISIVENIYDGLWFSSLPSYVIFTLTSSRFLAPLIRRFGANTAGVGVCFLSKQQWTDSVASTDMRVSDYTDFAAFKIHPLKKLILHLGNVRGGHFWVS